MAEVCPWCKTEPETTTPTWLFCPTANRFWHVSPIWEETQKLNKVNMLDNILRLFANVSVQGVKTFVLGKIGFCSGKQLNNTTKILLY